MAEFHSPVGRLVQGSVAMQHQKDMETNQPMYKDGQPVMSTFFALAFPKVLPNGQRNTEFDAFFNTLAQTAQAAWPSLFPQGVTPYIENIKPGMQGASSNPKFSWKYQDGDGHNASGQSVAGKNGFAGHHIIKFSTDFPVRCFNEGKFAAHEEIQNPAEVIKTGYWVRVFGETKTNNASGSQVPGIAIYPKIVSFVERGEEIVGGVDAETAFGSAAIGWRPPASSSPIPSPAAAAPAAPALPTPPPVAAPAVPAAPVVPAAPAVPVPPAAPAGPTVSAAMAAQGITWDMLKGQGWTEDAARAAGYLV